MRATIKQVAKAAGVSIGTVSQALRNTGDTSKATRSHVQKVAKSLGYRADPLLSRAMASIKSTPGKSNYEPIAYIRGFESKSLPHLKIADLKLDGAKERAGEIGYEITEYLWPDYSKQPKVLENLLYQRGIRGVIIGSQPNANTRIDIDWSKFTSVVLSNTVEHPQTIRVLGDHFQIVKLAISKLIQLGYKRIGFTMSPQRLERSDRMWNTAYRAYYSDLPQYPSIPELITAAPQNDFLEWYRKHNPDVIMHAKQEHYQLLIDAGYSVPSDCALVTLDISESCPEIDAGIYHNPEEVGKFAVNYISSCINNRDFGLPQHPKDILVSGTWIDGKSAPRKKLQ